MEFELWLFAIKNLAQTYEMSQVIFSQLPDAEKTALRKEYEKTTGGNTNAAKGGKTRGKSDLKKCEELVYGFHDALSITERFIEKNNIRVLRGKFTDSDDKELEFMLRMLIDMELKTAKVSRCLSYLSKPVTAEGEIGLDSFGQLNVEGRILTDGMLIEFYHNRWELGSVTKSEDAPYGYYFLGTSGEEFHINPNGLHVRLRG